MTWLITILPPGKNETWYTVNTKVEKEISWYWTFPTQQEAREFALALCELKDWTVKDLT